MSNDTTKHRQILLVALIGAIATLGAALIKVIPQLLDENVIEQSDTDYKHFYIVLNRSSFIRGSASIFIEDELVGSLEVNPGSDIDQLTVPLTEKSRLKYEIKGKIETRVYIDPQGTKVSFMEYYVTGKGIISPSNKEVIELRLNDLVMGGPGVGNFYIAVLEQIENNLSEIKLNLDELVIQLSEAPDYFLYQTLLKAYMTNSANIMGLSLTNMEALTNRNMTEIINYLLNSEWITQDAAEKYFKAVSNLKE